MCTEALFFFFFLFLKVGFVVIFYELVDFLLVVFHLSNILIGLPKRIRCWVPQIVKVLGLQNPHE